MKKLAIKILAFIFTLSFFTNLVYSDEQLLVALIYPQATNSPKKETKRKEKPVLITGNVSIGLTEVDPAQLNNPDVYVEFFLNNTLVYSTENNKPFAFILDSSLYPNGPHFLTVNLWDKAGASAIGIREIIIQNTEHNEN